MPDATILEEPEVSVADFRSTIADSDGDRRDGKFYRYTPDVELAVRVALAVNRPLLVFGPSGCGKSSLVFNLARLLGRRYYEFVVTSRSEAQDLYYRFDAVRRLGEAQAAAGAGDSWRTSYPFIEPGPLWWLYSPETARRRGSPADVDVKPAIDPGRWPPDYADPRDRVDVSKQVPSAVLLIDEIDKADADFPNNLLVPLGSRQFNVEETGDIIRLDVETLQGAPPLVVITSNRERELPVAFIRRCVVLEIAPFSDDDLIDLARKTFPDKPTESADAWRRLAAQLREVRPGEQVSPAEFLDTIRAIEKITCQEVDWRRIILTTSWTSNMPDREV